jgi:hypothetical protein
MEREKKLWLLETTRSHSTLFKRLSNPLLHPAVAFKLISASALPRMTYLIRCHHPSLTADACALFDKLLLEAVCLCLDLPIDMPPVSLQQLFSPKRSGGGGLRLQALTAGSAFFAAVAQAVPHLKKLSTNFDVAGSMPAWTQKHFFQSLRPIHENLKSQGVPVGPVFPGELANLPSVYGKGAPPKLQRLFTAFVEKRALQTAICNPLLAGVEQKVHAARVLSASDRHASVWMSDMSKERGVSLNAPQYRLSFRILLGIPLASPQPCSCGETTSDCRHLLTCGASKRRAFLDRHDLITNHLRALAVMAGAVATLLPRYCPQDGAANSAIDDPWTNAHGANAFKIPDLKIVTGTMEAALDITIGYPGTKSNLASACVFALTSAKNAEKQKNEKYVRRVEWEQDLVASVRSGSFQIRRTGCSFVPFALETNGALGPSARSFLSKLAKNAETYNLFSKSEFLRMAHRDISVLLQRCNARVLSYQRLDAMTRVSLGRVPYSAR